MKGVLWSILVLVVGTVIGWVTEDTLKRRTLEVIDSYAEKHIPWDSPMVQKVFPNEIAFESTTISGCSGGGLERLVEEAKNQGMSVREEGNAAATRLCQQWTYHGSARSVLNALANKFDNCFSVDQTKSFEVSMSSAYVCKTDYALNPKTNNWEKTQGAITILCLSQQVKTRMSGSEPYAHPCPDEVLQRLSFFK